ncbi:S1 family serine peptidase [Granulosicoccus antarcticus]|uniref:Trypsin-like protease n=1 Tax=Granulosicoccus antarcticus IMCC3135 TaxID=1192854 RepID=A0A2Z2P007_9GAMM|nr:serine protease [Granulosicoccus antarcticus]ASJ74490.1 Trypsin-like protease [Granulosicoccus antarcticus IMCC3135]
MPGLTSRSVLPTATAPVRMPAWHHFILMLCLVSPANLVLADSDSVTGVESEATSLNDVDAVLSGLDITRRVLGGDDSARDDWPSVVALASPGVASLYDRFYCGATVIAERWVMTAAHCLFDSFGQQDDASRILVAVGVHNLIEDESPAEHVVTNVIVHPDYDNSQESPPNDIALLELATAVEVPIGQLFVADTEDYTGTIAHVVGWGATRYLNERSANYPAIQQDAAVPLVSLATCNSPISYDGIINATQLCAGYAQGGVDACAGDSGGPLYIIEDGQILQVGITSFGSGCGEENFYGIYTNVSHYIPWIGTYVDVPEQSAELIAARQAAINGESTDNSNGGSSGGATSPLYLLLLGIASLVRGSVRRKHVLKLESRRMVHPFKKSFLVVPVVLLVSACSVPSVGGQAGNSRLPAAPLKETNSMSDAQQLVLNDASLRTGVDGLQLGDAHDKLMNELSGPQWQKPVCMTRKTAIRGTGRLFRTEHCSISAVDAVLLHGWQVRTVDLFLLDQQLVRLDVALAGASAESRDADSAELKAALKANYGQPASALEVTGKQGEGLSTPMTWQKQNDLVRLYAGESLQFIDARLESSFPALYEVEVPFDSL